jgi:Tfp pilus assembly protein PilE
LASGAVDIGAYNIEEYPDLQKVLEGCAAYCERLESIALDFVCKEEIKETIYNPYKPLEDSRRALLERNREIQTIDRNDYIYENVKYDDFRQDTESNKYVYDYQLIQKGDITEARTLLKENGRKKNEANAALKTKRFFHKFVILGPVGLLSHNSQNFFNFQIVKTAKMWGSKCVILEASPKTNQIDRQLWGKIWVDIDDYSVLKIEWDERSMTTYEGVIKQAEAFRARPELKFTSEYKVEKNGIRFPSKYSVKENYIRPSEFNAGMEKMAKSEIEVKYKDYKFFIVETEVEIKK